MIIRIKTILFIVRMVMVVIVYVVIYTSLNILQRFANKSISKSKKVLKEETDLCIVEKIN